MFNFESEKNYTMGKENKKYHMAHFKPWEGACYKHGIIGFNKNGHIVYGTEDNPGIKILVLGDSHYCAKPEDDKSSLTNDIIRDLLNPSSEHESYKNTYTKFIKSLTGYYDILTNDQKQDAWEHIMFYNYVQTPMSAARIAPTSDDYRDSDDAFFGVLKESDADLVIAWGKRLYNNLPQDGEQGEDLEILDGDYEGEAIEVWRYKVKQGTENKWVPVIGICHPSAAFVIEYWGALICAFIEHTIIQKGE